MLFVNSVDLFLEYVRSYCAIPTVEYYKINLVMFLRYISNIKGGVDFDVRELTKNDFVGYIFYLRSKPIKNTSVRTYSRAVKVFLRWLYFEGYLDTNITVHVKYPKADNELIIPLDNTRVRNIERGIENSPCCVRNKLIFSLMLDCGLRLQEVVALNISNIDFNRNYFSVIDTKNSKSRLVPLPARTYERIEEYCSLRADKQDILVLDDTMTERITKSAIKQVFGRLKKYDENIHAHLLRHTFGTSYIMGGGNFELLRVLMGHEDYKATKEYIHVATQMELLGLDIYRLDKCMFKAYQVYSYKEREVL